MDGGKDEGGIGQSPLRQGVRVVVRVAAGVRGGVGSVVGGWVVGGGKHVTLVPLVHTRLVRPPADR